MHVLLTGFDPWGTNRVNPSGEIARELGGEVLPVQYAAAGRVLGRLLRRRRPEALLMLGLAESRKEVALEAIAVNVDHSEERTHRRWRRPIAGGPLALPTRLPIDRLYRRLRRARIPVRISHHAGTFICNHVFYLGLRTTSGPCGFVHLPPFESVPRGEQLRAVRLILEELGKGGARRGEGTRQKGARSRPGSSG